MSKSVVFCALNRVCEILGRGGARIHFVGILGAGMLPLATLMAERGYKVTGSDAAAVRVRLDDRIRLSVPGDVSCAAECDLLVYSLAIREDNSEIRSALSAGVLCVSRAELLGFVVSSYKQSVGVAGSHGKSTATAMLSLTLRCLEPTVICGADFGDCCGLSVGGGELAVYEACEYRDAFLATRPTVAVLLNLELDHTDYFKSIEALRQSFLNYANSAALTVYNRDDENLELICRKFSRRAVSFGVCPHSDYRYEINGISERITFSIYKGRNPVGSFSLGVLGVFNVKNAVAAIVAALELGVPVSKIKAGIESFRGIGRRLERIGEISGCPLIYDYAHHPSEISSGIAALRAAGAEFVTVVFRPHTYSRTKSLWGGFVSSLSDADRVILLDVFPAREEAIEGVSSEALAAAIGECAEYADSAASAVRLLLEGRCGTVILMGAGDLSEVKDALTRKSIEKQI